VHWNDYRNSVDVELIFVPACPHLDLARQRLREALRAAGASATVRETEVSTADAAGNAGMHGSPTLLIDGRDPFPGGDCAASLSCRLYRVNRSIDGAPTVDQIVAALIEARVA
jgi:hypothetical protein